MSHYIRQYDRDPDGNVLTWSHTQGLSIRRIRHVPEPAILAAELFIM